MLGMFIGHRLNMHALEYHSDSLDDEINEGCLVEFIWLVQAKSSHAHLSSQFIRIGKKR